jgi:hypothetical protein
MNHSPDDICLYEDTPAGQFHSIIGQKGEEFEILVDTPNSVNHVQENCEKSSNPHFDLSNSDLSFEEKEQVHHLLSDYSDVFFKTFLRLWSY